MYGKNIIPKTMFWLQQLWSLFYYAMNKLAKPMLSKGCVFVASQHVRVWSDLFFFFNEDSTPAHTKSWLDYFKYIHKFVTTQQ